MNFKKNRQNIRASLNTKDAVKNFLQKHIGIDVTRDGFLKVRPDEKTASCRLNYDGSAHDYGTDEHYSDIVSLIYDGYHGFDSLYETIEWLCYELNISIETDHD